MIKPLTSLRFFFAFMVFLSHMWLLQDESIFLKQLYDDIFYEGYIGVSFFFILSGFVLAYNYHDRFLKKEISYSKFMLARFARIYPMHILTLIIAIPLSFQNDMLKWVGQLFVNLFLLHSFIPSDDFYFYFNSVSWSISVEWFFYLVFPFLVFLLHKRKYFKIIPLLLLGIPLLLLLVKENYHEKFFYINPLLRVGDFIIGILLFRIFRKRRVVALVHKKYLGTIFEVLSIVILSLFLYYHNDIPQGFRYSCYYWPPMALLIYTFSYSKGIVSRILSNNTLVYLGEISFGFYMIHMLVFRYYEYILLKVPSLSTFLPTNYIEVIIIFFISLIASMVLYKWYELPTNKYLKEKLAHKFSQKKPLTR